MNRVLVVQLARMGDVTQSLYLLGDLAGTGEEGVSVLVDRRMEAFVRARAPWVESVHTLDLERYLRAFREGRDWTGLWDEMAAELEAIARGPFDRILNLNYGRLSGAVVEAVRRGRPVEGFHARPPGSAGEAWLAWTVRTVRADRRWNRFHLVDVFRFLAGGKGRRERSSSRPWRPLTDRSTLGVQIATREPRRSWPPERFVEVIRALARDPGCEILLVGEPRDRPLAERILRSGGSGRVRNLVGETDMEALASVLAECDLLLSADTGPLHLAAWLGTPTLGLFFGPAYHAETGPYGTGHRVIQVQVPCSPCPETRPCRRPYCRTALSAAAVVALLRGEPPVADPSVRIYVGGFEGNWMQYRPMRPYPATREDVIGCLYWGSAGALLGREMELPSLSAAIDFLLAHYRIDGALLRELGGSIGSAVPEGMDGEEAERLASLLRRGWRELKERHHEQEGPGEEPGELAWATA